MSRSAIYVANTGSQNIPIDGEINLGTVIRRFGQNVALSGNGLRLEGQGYYNINASFTATPTGAGTVTITAYANGVAIPGATASETVAGTATTVNLSIDALYRLVCPCEGATITFVLSGISSTVTNSAIVVDKL